MDNRNIELPQFTWGRGRRNLISNLLAIAIGKYRHEKTVQSDLILETYCEWVALWDRNMEVAKQPRANPYVKNGSKINLGILCFTRA